MHLAIQTSNTQRPVNIVKRLMLKGASLDIKDNKGRTPIELCAKRAAKNQLLVEALKALERADPTKKSCWVKFKESLMVQQSLSK